MISLLTLKHYIVMHLRFVLRFSSAILFMVFLSLTQACTPGKNGDDTIRILWLGSSSTYMHEMPLQMQEWLNKYGSGTYYCDLTGRSGTGFHDYLNPDFEFQYGVEEDQGLLEKIASNSFDFVVLQMITYFINSEDSTEVSEATEIVCNAVRKAGGEPVFFEMGWANDTVNLIGRKMVREEARKNRIQYYAPCSEAWAQVRNERADIELFNLPDSDHPGTLGNYLNMTVLFKCLTGRLPEPMPLTIRSWPGFGSFDKDSARVKLQDYKLDSFHSDHPEFIRLMSVMQTKSQISETTAEYFRKVAKELDYKVEF